jgi:hypothetical protein
LIATQPRGVQCLTEATSNTLLHYPGTPVVSYYCCVNRFHPQTINLSSRLVSMRFSCVASIVLVLSGSSFAANVSSPEPPPMQSLRGSFFAANAPSEQTLSMRSLIATTPMPSSMPSSMPTCSMELYNQTSEIETLSNAGDTLSFPFEALPPTATAVSVTVFYKGDLSQYNIDYFIV